MYKQCYKDEFNEICRLIGKHSFSACDAVGMTLTGSEADELVRDLKELFKDKKGKKDEYNR